MAASLPSTDEPWTFAIRKVSPRGDTPARHDAVIRVFFNGLPLLEQNPRRFVRIEPPPVILDAAFDQHVLTLVPERLDYATHYVVTVDALEGLPRRGRTPVRAEPLRWEFDTLTNAASEELALQAGAPAEALAIDAPAAPGLASLTPAGAWGSGATTLAVAGTPLPEDDRSQQLGPLVWAAAALARGAPTGGATVVCQKIRGGFLAYLRETAIPERLATRWPHRPLLTRTIQSDDVYLLPRAADRTLYIAARLGEARCQAEAGAPCNAAAAAASQKRAAADTPAQRIAAALAGPCFAESLNGASPEDVAVVLRRGRLLDEPPGR